MAMFQEAYFQDPEAAREQLEGTLWPDGPVCPHCGCTGNTTRLQGAKHRPGVHKCNDCKRQFTVTVGTVFERSHIKLHIWFQAVYLLCSSKKGMSAHQMHRMLGVSYETAWFMAHRIREAMDEGDFPEQLGGVGETVEVDETYCGTIPGATMYRGGHHKNKVVSLVERNGEARSFHVDRVNGATLRPMLAEHIAADTRIMTDEAYWYKWLPKDSHFTVNHLAKEYARDDVTTNTVEGFFATFKRGLNGTYHHISSDHLGSYLNEFDFRYNTRKLTDMDRTRLALKGIAGKRLTYHDC